MRPAQSYKPPRPKPAFTLIELLVVMAVIVLLITLAVPVFNLFSGKGSIAGAQSAIAARLGGARAHAMQSHRTAGVLFFFDSATQHMSVAMVQDSGRAPQAATATVPAVDVFLDLVPDREFMPVPVGVMAQVIDHAVINASGIRQDDSYIGLNPFQHADLLAPGMSIPIGGVILFDSSGQLVSLRYGFKLYQGQAPNYKWTRMGTLLFPDYYTGTPVIDAAPKDFTDPSAAQPPAPRSSFGLVLFDWEQFRNQGFATDDDPQFQKTASDAIAKEASEYTTANLNEEQWIDANAIPFLVHRYNGTLIKGE